MKTSMLKCLAAGMGLLLLACSAQAQPGFDAVWALAQQPGAVGSYASSSSGGGGTMISTSTTGSGGAAMASSTAGGVTRRASSHSGQGCTAQTSSNTQVCDGGNCCTVQSKVSKCEKYLTANAKINEAWGRCCVVLMKEPSNTPALFCAGPPAKEYYTFPLDAQVTLKPSCNNVFKTANQGSLSCSVYLPNVPKGFSVPVEKPLVYNAAATFKPCMGKSWKRMTQAVSKASPQYITSRCD